MTVRKSMPIHALFSTICIGRLLNTMRFKTGIAKGTMKFTSTGEQMFLDELRYRFPECISFC